MSRNWNRHWGTFGAVATLLLAFATPASAENLLSQFLRVDPKTHVAEDKNHRTSPVISMLVEIGSQTPINDFGTDCAPPKVGTSRYSSECLKSMSAKIEKKGYFAHEAFPDKGEVIAIVGGKPAPMTIEEIADFDAKDAPNAGTAWLILLDASSSVGNRWTLEQQVAEDLIKGMGKNDAVRVEVINDRNVQQQTKWLAAKNKQQAINLFRAIKTAFAQTTQAKDLIEIIKTQTVGSFQDLFAHGVDGSDATPLMQAVVILSDGNSTAATSLAASQEALAAHNDLVQGASVLIQATRLPMPVITIWFPKNDWVGLQPEQLRNNEYEWMSNLATPEVGGYFDIYQEGEPLSKAQTIATTVQNRFKEMQILSVRPSCLEVGIEQKLQMIFKGTPKTIAPATWEKIAIDYDVTGWPLDVSKKQTEDAAQKTPLKMGETFKVFGNFCWGTDVNAAEAYFVTDADLPDIKKASQANTPEAAKSLFQTLASRNQKAKAVHVDMGTVEFEMPKNTALFDRQGDLFFNVIVVDTTSFRASATSANDKNGILALRGERTTNMLLVGGAIGGGVVLILLIAILARSGGGGGRAPRRRRGGGGPAPSPAQPPGASFQSSMGSPAAASPPGFGAVGAAIPPNYGAPMPAAPLGYSPERIGAPIAAMGAAPTAFAPPQAPYAPPATQPVAFQSPQIGGGPNPYFAQASNATSIPITCPSCHQMVMMPPQGDGAQCAFCGAMVSNTGQATPTAGKGFGLTSHAQIGSLQPQSPPLAQSGAGISGNAVLTGEAGSYPVLEGVEMRVGRDGTSCSIVLQEPRVSSNHASIRRENGVIAVRDDHSHNGTFVNGTRIQSGVWTVLSLGFTVRFGPAEFTLRAGN